MTSNGYDLISANGHSSPIPAICFQYWIFVHDAYFTLGRMTTPSSEQPSPVSIEQPVLDRWAETALRVNHLHTLVQRALSERSLERAEALSERARVAIFSLFDELLASGAQLATTEPEYPYAHWYRGLALESIGRSHDARNEFDAFAQGIAATGKPVPEALAEAVAQKLRQYGLAGLYNEGGSAP